MEMKWIMSLMLLTVIIYACTHICFYIYMIIKYYKTRETDIFHTKLRITSIAAIYTIFLIEKIRYFIGKNTMGNKKEKIKHLNNNLCDVA